MLHHVRTLVRGGFLAAEPVREGRRGALERPYRATGKSWQVRITPSADHLVSVMDAVRDEILEAGADATLSSMRLGVRLLPGRGGVAARGRVPQSAGRGCRGPLDRRPQRVVVDEVDLEDGWASRSPRCAPSVAGGAHVVPPGRR